MKDEAKSKQLDSIHFDIPSVREAIEKNGKYISGKVTVKKWEGEEESQNQKMYILKNDEKPPYMGIINTYFERYGVCINEYQNQDKYFGFYKFDERDSHGFYAYKPTKNKNNLLSEFYFGLWKKDVKDIRGTYLWLNEDAKTKPFSDFDKANFNVFVGEIVKQKPSKGTLLSKEGDDYLVYHGGFNEHLKREGDKCFFYSATLEELCFGTYKDNNFVKGYVANFDDDGNVKDILYFDNGKITPKEKIEKSDLEKNQKILSTFRNVVLGKDYFGEIYEVFGKALNFSQKEMTTVDIFNSDKYLSIISILASHNKISVFNDIEKLVEY